MRGTVFPPSCRWWPFIGIVFFALPWVFGFGCNRTEPDVPTDPGVPTETQEDVQVLTSPEPFGPTIPSAAFAVLSLAGLGAAALVRGRDS